MILAWASPFNYSHYRRAYGSGKTSAGELGDLKGLNQAKSVKKIGETKFPVSYFGHACPK